MALAAFLRCVNVMQRRGIGKESNVGMEWTAIQGGSNVTKNRRQRWSRTARAKVEAHVWLKFLRAGALEETWAPGAPR